MPTLEQPRTVLLLGDEPRITVSVARPLADAGHRVVVARPDSGRRVPSRAIAEHLTLPGALAGDGAAAALVDYLTRHRVDVIIPCTDSALTLIAAYEGRLRELTVVAAPAAASLYRVLDKAATMELAASLGIPCPRTVSAIDRAALAAARDTLTFPLVAKPRHKTAAARFKVRHYPDFAAVDAEFAADPDFGVHHVIQEFAAGDGLLVGALAVAGEIVAVSQQRRVHEWPWSGGVATCAVSELPDPVLLEHSRALVRALAWEGLLQVEFRHETASGRGTLLEVNGRVWGFHNLAVHAGVNMPDLLMRGLGGERIAPLQVNRPGVRMIWCAGELKRLHTVWRNTNAVLSPPSVWRGMVEPLRELARGPAHAIWAWRDPLPAVAEFANEFAAIVAAEVRTLLHPLIPEWVLRRRRRARRSA